MFCKMCLYFQKMAGYSLTSPNGQRENIVIFSAIWSIRCGVAEEEEQVFEAAL